MHGNKWHTAKCSDVLGVPGGGIGGSIKRQACVKDPWLHSALRAVGNERRLCSVSPETSARDDRVLSVDGVPHRGLYPLDDRHHLGLLRRGYAVIAAPVRDTVLGC